MLSKDLKIFLSSTSKDLKSVREKVLKFLSVLKSDMINMETFGSDETAPKEYCLLKVNESNLFIGIYAERYGHIDKETDLSMTELEYHSAFEKFQRNELLGILLYALDEKASWPIENIDRENKKVKKLKKFKALLDSRHVITRFLEIEELPFNVLRDVIRKLELGASKLFKSKEITPSPQQSILDSPIGMEFFSRNLASFFYGRDDEIDKISSQIITFNFSLLIGISGIGKTSLINAGILPAFENLNWHVAVIRPLNEAKKNLKTFLWSTFFYEKLPYDFELIDVIQTILLTIPKKKFIIIIDQFEDILNSKNPADIDYLISQLSHVFILKESNLHILISYRGDVESEIGFIWQKISGAPDGLPRYYLKSFSKASTKVIFERTLKDLKIQTNETVSNTILDDLETESFSNGHKGIFPPFLQMIISSIYRVTEQDKTVSIELYNGLGRARQIIAGFLFDQLDYLGSHRENGIKVLISLVSNYGSKIQKTFDEVKLETSLDKHLLESTLSELVDLRLIRTIENEFEVTHDLLAKTILQNLITDDERNFRKFQFLLNSKAEAFDSTKSSLISLEHLFIYKYRERIYSTEKEVILLIDSFLENKTPVYYWLNKDHIDLDKGIAKKISNLAKSDFDLLNIPWDFKDLDILVTEADITELEVQKLSKGTTEASVKNFFLKTLNFSKGISLENGKDYLNQKQQWKNLIGLMVIGEKGSIQEMDLLKQLLISGNSKISALALVAIARISWKFNNYDALQEMILSYKGPYFQFVIEEITKCTGFYIDINILIDTVITKADFEYAKFILKIIEQSKNEKSTNVLKSDFENEIRLRFFERHNLLPAYLNVLVLGSSAEDFIYFLNLFISANHSYKISYRYFLHEKIASLAADSHYEYLKNIVSKELKTLTDSSYNNKLFDDINFENDDNRYFFAWIVFSAFFNLIKEEDKELLFDGLHHFLYTARIAAIKGFYKLGNEIDLNRLVDIATSYSPSKVLESIITATRILDMKLYLNQGTLAVINAEYIIRKNKEDDIFYPEQTDSYAAKYGTNLGQELPF